MPNAGHTTCPVHLAVSLVKQPVRGNPLHKPNMVNAANKNNTNNARMHGVGHITGNVLLQPIHGVGHIAKPKAISSPPNGLATGLGNDTSYLKITHHGPP